MTARIGRHDLTYAALQPGSPVRAEHTASMYLLLARTDSTIPPMAAPPQSAAVILMAGGGLGKSRAKTALCKAFNQAAKEWCAEDPGKRGKFNDRFYEKLNSQKPAPKFLEAMEREVPALWQGGSAVGGNAGQMGIIGLVASGAKSLARTTARAMSTRMGNLLAGYGAVQGPLGGMLVTSVTSPAGRGIADKAQFRLHK